MLGLHFCARAFSSCGKQGSLFIAVRGPLTIAASPVAEHRLQTRRLSSCGSRTQLLPSMWDPPRPGLEPVSPALAGRFSTTAPPGKPTSQVLMEQDWLLNSPLWVSGLHRLLDGDGSVPHGPLHGPLYNMAPGFVQSEGWREWKRSPKWKPLLFWGNDIPLRLLYSTQLQQVTRSRPHSRRGNLHKGMNMRRWGGFHWGSS